MANDITVSQYERALGSLTKEEKDFLVKLYHVEPASDQYEIGRKLGYKGSPNLRISNIGKRISKFLNIEPDLSGYNDKVKEKGWFFFIHRAYRQYLEKQNSIAEIYNKETYWDMEPNLRTALENLGLVNQHDSYDEEILNTEIDEQERLLYPEGTLVQKWVLKAERNRQAIEAAKQLKGDICKGCEINFKGIYGGDVPNIIEYHHINQMKSGERETNPETDLFPLCPNCHAVVHSQKELMTIEELQKRIKGNNQNPSNSN